MKGAKQPDDVMKEGDVNSSESQTKTAPTYYWWERNWRWLTTVLAIIIVVPVYLLHNATMQEIGKILPAPDPWKQTIWAAIGIYVVLAAVTLACFHYKGEKWKPVWAGAVFWIAAICLFHGWRYEYIKPNPPASEIAQPIAQEAETITLLANQKKTYELEKKQETSHWILVPTGVKYAIDGDDIRIKFSNGTIVDLRPNENVDLGRICPAKFKIQNKKDKSQTVTITGTKE